VAGAGDAAEAATCGRGAALLRGSGRPGDRRHPRLLGGRAIQGYISKALAALRSRAANPALIGLDGIEIDMPGIDPVALATQLRGLDGTDLIGIVSKRFQPSGNGSIEQLDPVVAPLLFAALRNGTFNAFVNAHPDWVVSH
jgi:hypothetical protein